MINTSCKNFQHYNKKLDGVDSAIQLLGYGIQNLQLFASMFQFNYRLSGELIMTFDA